MKQDNRFEGLDKAALHSALLALKTCPRCRGKLGQVGTSAKAYELWACDECGTTWQVRKGDVEEGPFDDGWLPRKVDP